MLSYNTQKENVVLSEYGRNVQGLVDNLNNIEDEEKRNNAAKTIVKVMANLNPSIKELDNYEQTLWDHLHFMGKFKLNIESPYPVPAPEELAAPPNDIKYTDTRIKYRVYGRNLQKMVESAVQLPDSELKKSYLNLIASFMVNSSRNWNDEHLTNEQVAEHLKDLSKGELIVNPEELVIHLEARRKKPVLHKNKKKKRRR